MPNEPSAILTIKLVPVPILQTASGPPSKGTMSRRSVIRCRSLGQLQSMGFYVSSNPANSYFYLLTAVHGLHLIGGLVALSNVVFRVWYDGELSNLSGPLKLCTTYWHFLLAVWLFLFALLTSTPDTINALTALCGF